MSIIQRPLLGQISLCPPSDVAHIMIMSLQKLPPDGDLKDSDISSLLLNKDYKGVGLFKRCRATTRTFLLEVILNSIIIQIC